MKIIQPSFEILPYSEYITKVIEYAGRKCWKSEDRIEEDSDIKFIQMLKGVNHASVLEHGSISVNFVCDRGVSHELVRHRLASYSQESTRYCNYSKGKYGSEISVIEPFFYTDRPVLYASWKRGCESAEIEYMFQLENGAKAQEARDNLPNSLKTEVVATFNPREWRHVFTLRTSPAAHPQIRQIMCPTLKRFREIWPVLFDDVGSVEHECSAVELINTLN